MVTQERNALLKFSAKIKIFEKKLRQWALVQVAKGKVNLETLVLNKRS